jgi:hypothetical protein
LDAATEFLDCSEGALLSYVFLLTVQGIRAVKLPDAPYSEEDEEHARSEISRVTNEMRTAYYQVLLVGGNESRGLAEEMANLVNEAVNPSSIMADEDAEPAPDPDHQLAVVAEATDAAGKAMERYHELGTLYRRAVRVELGTRDDSWHECAGQ